MPGSRFATHLPHTKTPRDSGRKTKQMHGKEQPPSVKALEGRARKAARAAEKAAAAEAAAEAEEAARWQVGARGKTAREVRAEKGQMKGARTAEKKELEKIDESKAKREKRWGVQREVNMEERKKEDIKREQEQWKLELEEALLESRTKDEAMEKMVETCTKKYEYGEERWGSGKRRFTAHLREVNRGGIHKQRVVKREAWRLMEEYEGYKWRREKEMEDNGERRGTRKMKEEIWREWMEKKGVGKEGDLEETREKLEKKRREGEKREIEWMFSRGCGKGYVCAGRSVWRLSLIHISEPTRRS